MANTTGWFGLTERLGAPKLHLPPCWQQHLAGCTSANCCISALEISAHLAPLQGWCCCVGAVGRIGNETVRGSLNERPEGPGLGELELCVGGSFWSRDGILRSCLLGQMCGISAVDETAGNSLGHSTEAVVRQPAKHL